MQKNSVTNTVSHAWAPLTYEAYFRVPQKAFYVYAFLTEALHLSSYCKFLALFSSFLYNKEQLYIRGYFHSALGLIPQMYRILYSTVGKVQVNLDIFITQTCLAVNGPK